jgi:hypothetical protein
VSIRSLNVIEINTNVIALKSRSEIESVFNGYGSIRAIGLDLYPSNIHKQGRAIELVGKLLCAWSADHQFQRIQRRQQHGPSR